MTQHGLLTNRSYYSNILRSNFEVHQLQYLTLVFSQELRGILVEGKKQTHRQRESNWPDSPRQPRARTVRKITPVQRPGPSPSLDISSNLPNGEKVAAEHGSDSQDDQLKLKLQVLTTL